MALEFTTHFSLRQYEMDARGELPNSALARLLQETAIHATQDAGFGTEWFTERRNVWVIHEMTLEHLHPIRYPAELAITTWLSDIQRVSTHREYLARDVATNEIVARARVHWVHLSADTLAPARIPQEIGERFAPNGIRAVPRVEPRVYGRDNPAPTQAFRAHRRAQRYETDSLQHVNNTVYLDWVEETLADAARPSTALRSAQDARLCVRRHDIAYVRPALPPDEVEIIAQMIGAGQCASAWSVEIKRGDESLVRDHVTALWVDANGKPVKL